MLPKLEHVRSVFSDIGDFSSDERIPVSDFISEKFCISTREQGQEKEGREGGRREEGRGMLMMPPPPQVGGCPC